MAILVALNGPPGIGKSTLADRTAAQVIWTQDGQVDAAYQQLLRVVQAAGRQ